jgi:DNA-binding MurR/RpiR family transcriptional regulator
MTDNTLSPIARHAGTILVLPTAGTSFYQSLVPTMALLEGLVCYLVARAGPRMVERVKEEFERRDRFGVYWRDRG